MTYWTYLIDTVAWFMGLSSVLLIVFYPLAFMEDDLPKLVRVAWIPAAILFTILGWSMVAYRGDGGVWF